MIGLLIALALTAEHGQNDLKEPKATPDSVHVAICTGTDIDEKEVLLLDRVCLNRPSAMTVTLALEGLQTERNSLLKQVNDTNKLRVEEQAEAQQKAIIAAVSGAGVATVIITGILLGLKAAGKL